MISLFARVRKAVLSLFGSRYLVVSLSVPFFLILGAAFFLIYQNAGIMRDQISEDFNQQQLILARQVAAQIDANLNDIEVELDGLQRHYGERSACACEQAMQEVFDRTRSKGLVEIGLLEPGRGIVAEEHLPGIQPESPGDVAAECQWSETELMVLGPLRVGTDASGKSRVTGLLCRRVDSPGAAGRVLFARLDVSAFVARATRDIRSGQTGYAWVINQAGTFLYHPEKEFIGQNAFIARQKREPYISFVQINQIMKDRMLRGHEGTGTYVSGWHRGIQGHITKLIAFTPVKSRALSPGQAWSVAVVAPTSEVAGTVHRMYFRNFAVEVAMIAGMFVFGLLGVVYQRRLSQALEKKMSQQEEYMASILQNSVDAILFVDNDNRVKVWNHGAELIFGYRADEMLGQTFHRLIPPELDAEEELQRLREEAVTRGFVRHHIAPRVTRDGRRITVDISRAVVRSRDGEIIGSTAIIRDVTEQMKWEQRIYHTEKLASIGNLAAGVAHEINNPLAIILGFSDLLLERFEPGSSEYQDLKMIEENANQAKKTVENLLGFARITEGMEDTVDVLHCVQTVVNIVKNTLLTGKISLVTDVPESLPRVCGDAREFQQVIFNLINNSVAAMQEEGGVLTLSARADGDRVQLSVADTGTGIPDRIKPRIFDPFFTTKKVGKGTGLGLSLCYGIVNKYGGKIDFTSVSAEDRPGEPTGTTFTVSMPVCESAEQAKGKDDETANSGRG
jgi:two-component system NtrC family sensor kinase